MQLLKTPEKFGSIETALLFNSMAEYFVNCPQELYRAGAVRNGSRSGLNGAIVDEYILPCGSVVYCGYQMNPKGHTEPGIMKRFLEILIGKDLD